MASIQQRYHRWDAKVRVPRALIDRHGGREWLYLRLQSNNRRAAEIEAREWENGLRAEWARELGHDTAATEKVRQRRRAEYTETRDAALAGEFKAYAAGEDPVDFGIDMEIDRIADLNESRDLTEIEEARLAALNDAIRVRQGRSPKRREELELSFTELGEEFLKWWKGQDGLKPSNTEQQKRATYKLFAGYWGDKPIRRATRSEAVKFFDALRSLEPSWGRSATGKALSWADLQARFGGRDRGLSDATMNRHSASLQELWRWAEERGHCSGQNPFGGFRRRLRQGINVRGYVAWEASELNKLFNPGPKRVDLTELMLVGLYSGMRLDEIASLRGSQVREDEGVTYIQVEDAKTPAGNRQVPLHPELGWLKGRAQATGDDRIWPTFNPEGPGKKAGADAGREFSRFKQSKGFGSRTKTFHSFRKNVTRQMERAQVRENEWAQVFGHERGFTYGRYNPDGITLAQKAEIIAHIAYPKVKLPKPAPHSGD